MNDTICLNKNYSTTRLLCKITNDECLMLNEDGRLKEECKWNINNLEFNIKNSKLIGSPEDKFETTLFLPEGEGRKGEGGLRTKGYFKKSFEDKPLISIITVVYNGEQYLEETILSVINQTYDNVEYIIIDGGSSDETLDIIKKYEDRIDYWVSEKDDGISDAFNKGVKVSSGDYINFQGDGDGFVSLDALEKVFQDINPDEDIFVSNRIQRVDVDGKEIFTSNHIKSFDKRSLLFRMSMPHQGLFTHKSYFEKYGLFDVNNTFCMDYEHLLRSYKEFPKVVTKNLVLARWRADGIGNGRTLEIFKEYDKIKRDNNVANSLVLDFIKYWTLFKYYVKQLIRRV